MLARLKSLLARRGGGRAQAPHLHTMLRQRVKEQSYGAPSSKLALLLHPLLPDSRPAPPGAAARLHCLPVPPVRPWFVLHPLGWPRMLWDAAAVFLICSLALLIPVTIAFYEQDDTCDYFSADAEGYAARWGFPWPRSAMAFISFTNAFFLLDILLNFVTGVYTVVDEQEVISFELGRIARNYLDLRSDPNFWIDAVACLPLNCILVAAGASTYNLGQLVRLLRVLTIGRRAHGSPFRFLDRVSELRQEFSYNLRRLIVMVSVVFVLLHYLACLLWITLRVQGFPPGTWADELNVHEGSVIEAWLWSFFAVTSAMIGLGYASYPPQTWPEALVYIIIMISSNATWAFLNGLIFSIVLSNVSGTQEYKDYMDRALAMLKARKVPKPLRHKVLEYLKHKHARHRILKDSAILEVPETCTRLLRLLQDLPRAIQVQLACVSVGSVLSSLPLFADNTHLLEDTAPFVKRTVAIEGQVLHQQGHAVNQMYFIRTGFVDVHCDGRLVDTLGEGHHFGELALLQVPAAPQGEGLPAGVALHGRFASPVTVSALSHCELYTLAAEDFERVAAQHPEVAPQLEQAALRHCRHLTKYHAGDVAVHACVGRSPAAAFPLGVLGGRNRSMTTPEAPGVEGPLGCGLAAVHRPLVRCSMSNLDTMLSGGFKDALGALGSGARAVSKGGKWAPPRVDLGVTAAAAAPQAQRPPLRESKDMEGMERGVEQEGSG